MFEIEAYLPYVGASAHKFLGSKQSQHYDDLVQEGVIALLEAYKTYDITSEVSFITYSRRALHGAFTNYMRSLKVVTKKVNSKPVPSDILIEHTDQLVFENEEGEGMFELVREELTYNPEIDEEILSLELRAEKVLTQEQYETFWKIYGEDMTQAELAKEQGITPQAARSRVQTINKKLLGVKTW